MAADQGGGIFNAGALILGNSIVTDNTAAVGGGIYNCPEGQLWAVNAPSTAL